MKKEEIRFEIDKLQKNQLINAVQSLVILASFLIIIFIVMSVGYNLHPMLGSQWTPAIIGSLAIIIALLFGIKSSKAGMKIKELEREL